MEQAEPGLAFSPIGEEDVHLGKGKDSTYEEQELQPLLLSEALRQCQIPVCIECLHCGAEYPGTMEESGLGEDSGDLGDGQKEHLPKGSWRCRCGQVSEEAEGAGWACSTAQRHGGLGSPELIVR